MYYLTSEKIFKIIHLIRADSVTWLNLLISSTQSVTLFANKDSFTPSFPNKYIYKAHPKLFLGPQQSPEILISGLKIIVFCGSSAPGCAQT